MPKIKLAPSDILGTINSNKLSSPLVLAANPTENMHAATKQYVDNTLTSSMGTLDATKLTGLVPLASLSGITGTQLSASANIADTQLSTISTAGKVANSATTATHLNTASAIVARDASGNFSAGTISATFSGNGSAITNLNASNVTTGVLPESVLPKATARYADLFLLMGA